MKTQSGYQEGQGQADANQRQHGGEHGAMFEVTAFNNPKRIGPEISPGLEIYDQADGQRIRMAAGPIPVNESAQAEQDQGHLRAFKNAMKDLGWKFRSERDQDFPDMNFVHALKMRPGRSGIQERSEKCLTQKG